MRFAWIAHLIFLIAAELLAALILVLAAPHASAQFFFDNRFSNGPAPSGRAVQQQPQWFWPSQNWQQWQQSVPRHVPRRLPRVKEANEPDFSKAPPARKRDSPTSRVMVMGDSMADWLAYGLEDALSETPEIGVIRKVRSFSGLLPGESRDAHDWPLAAREILAADTPDFVVMMIGLADRQAIGERQIRNAAQQQAQQQSFPAPSSAAVEVEQAKAPHDASTTTKYDFRSDKWGRFYGKRIDDTIAALKSRGVPVLWVGLPAIRGSKSTADIAHLDDLYRSHAEKAGIIYIDVWDGFVDEDGDFALYGPDFDGQTRRLRTSDGVYFTKAGALKLGHYVERELRRMMLAQPTAVGPPGPEPPQTQAFGIRSRTSPLAGPVVALTAPESTPDSLLGDKLKPPFTDSITTGVLVRGEPIVAPPGRADDFVWPRRESLPGPATSEATPDPRSPMLPAHASPTSKRSADADHAASKAVRKHVPKHAMPRSLGRPSWRFGATGRFSAFWPIGLSR
jgi:uncharacterized protein